MSKQQEEGSSSDANNNNNNNGKEGVIQTLNSENNSSETDKLIAEGEGEEAAVAPDTIKPKFSVTKLEEEAINDPPKRVPRVTIMEDKNDDAKKEEEDEDEDDEENKESFDSNADTSNVFANRKNHRFKTQKSIFDPIPHVDNYRNMLSINSSNSSRDPSKLNLDSNFSSSGNENTLSQSDPQYENTISANDDTINKADQQYIRPTLRELQTSTGVSKKDPNIEKRAKKGRLRSLSRLSFHSKKNNQIAKMLSEKQEKDDEEKGLGKKKKSSPGAKGNIIKFGWIKGVLIRCVLNIFGIMIFLRLTWIVGQAGLMHTTIIISIATVVTIITSLSTSAISTNGEIKGGGAYYLISRSLGPEFGGAIGLVFSFANAVASAMYVIGFSETLVFSVLNKYGLNIIDGGINDVRIVGLITVVFLLLIAGVGMKWEAKVQSFLLLILCIAFADFLIGAALKPNEEQIGKGFIGINVNLLWKNMQPDYRDGETFGHIFSIYFPAVTGILAGANISGNLKDPATAIPKGTLLSVIITTLTYLLFGWVAGLTVMREATGIPTNETNLTSLFENATDYCAENKCKYGLLNDYDAISLVSVFSPVILAGIFSASLSSALASLVSAPKIFQAVGKDKIFPKIEYFAVGYGKDKEPLRGYALTFVIACLFIAIGELNAIAPIISNFFLMSYALINYACFDASISKTPGWRPSFKYYNKWISFFGAIVCISIMFVIKWWAALVSFLSIISIYLYVKQRKPDINWGSTGQAHIYRKSLEYSLKLMNIKEHVKNYRPNFLVLTGEPSKRPALCDFVSSISKTTSLMICANVNITSEVGDPLRLNSNDVYSWLRKRKIKSFFSDVNASSLRSGATCLMQSTGIGKLKPNAVVMGFKNDWNIDRIDSTMEYYNLINDIFQMEFSLLILCVGDGLDFSDLLGEEIFCNEGNSESSDDDDFFKDLDENETDIDEPQSQMYIENELNRNHKMLFNEMEMEEMSEVEAGCSTVPTSSSIPTNPLTAAIAQPENINLDSLNVNDNNQVQMENNNQEEKPLISAMKQRKGSVTSKQLNFKSTELMKLKGSKINMGVLQGMKMFHNKHQEGFIDVYWLHDDGGLTILIPYLLAQRKHWKKCKLRIFCQTNSKTADIAKEKKNMEMLLHKFRIDFHELIILSNLRSKPNPASVALFDRILDNWRLQPNESSKDFPYKVTDEQYREHHHKINYYLRIREVMIEHSREATLIFVTITVPNKIRTIPALYLSYLDVISRNLPPIVMIRGNQNQVVTYYS